MNDPRAARLLYVADPLCSWCYGFGPELARILERLPDLGLDLLMGGLRPYNEETMSEAFREMLRGHWAHVAQVSGLPFSEAIFDVPGFVYDTEPPCRAVVAARSLDPGRAFALMKEIQSSFYRDGIDMTRAEALADAAQRCGYERDAFRAALDSPAMREATRADFAKSRSLGVTGFPTLALAVNGELYLVASGYTPAAMLEERIGQIAGRLRRPADDARNAV